MAEDLTDLLDHSRGLFIYHAGQRLTSIRYFFATYALFAAGYLPFFQKADTNYAGVQLALSLGALVLTVAYWGLDVRNAEMVEIDEDAMKEIENSFVAQNPTGKTLKFFNMTERWESAEHRKVKSKCWQKIIKYSCIVPALFIAFSLLSIVGALRALTLLIL